MIPTGIQCSRRKMYSIFFITIIIISQSIKFGYIVETPESIVIAPVVFARTLISLRAFSKLSAYFFFVTYSDDFLQQV